MQKKPTWLELAITRLNTIQSDHAWNATNFVEPKVSLERNPKEPIRNPKEPYGTLRNPKEP